jgi:hypothetical protein
MEEKKIQMTEDIEYFLLKAKSAIEQALETKDPTICLSSILQAEITIRSHISHIQKDNSELINTKSRIIE